jgi:hypothetical protein
MSTELSELTTCIGKLICSYHPTLQNPGFASPKSTTTPGLHVYLLHVERAGRIQPFVTQGRSDGAVSVAIIARYLVFAVNDTTNLDSLDQLQYAIQAVADSAALLPTIFANHSTRLKLQTELVRVSMHPIESREFFDMWSTLQAPHVPSFVIEAAVLLLKSNQQRSVPPPVAVRAGTEPAENPIASAGMDPGFPMLLEAIPISGRPGPCFLFGETVKFRGSRLQTESAPPSQFHLSKIGSSYQAFVQSAWDSATGNLDLELNDTSLTIGVYSVSLLTYEKSNGATQYDVERESNALQIELRPSITEISTDSQASWTNVSPPPGNTTVELKTSGDFSLSLKTNPLLQAGQQVALFLNERAFSGNVTTSVAEFQCSGLSPGDYRIRLRVDGLESLLIHSVNGSLAYSSPILKITRP